MPHERLHGPSLLLWWQEEGHCCMPHERLHGPSLLLWWREEGAEGPSCLPHERADGFNRQTCQHKTNANIQRNQASKKRRANRVGRVEVEQARAFVPYRDGDECPARVWPY